MKKINIKSELIQHSRAVSLYLHNLHNSVLGRVSCSSTGITVLFMSLNQLNLPDFVHIAVS
jgi:hypothetical protein